MRAGHSIGPIGGLLCAATLAQGIDLDVNNTQSILDASKTIVQNILGIYSSSSIPGLFPEPYYWWESGLAFNSLVNYYSASGDQDVLQTIQDGLLWQVGPQYNYMPPNQSKSEGNDDQAQWGLAVMTAAEQGLPPRANQDVTWLKLAQNVFDSQVLRWDSSSCEGGLRWQIFTFNVGYNYKNSATQGSFAELAARLARYTGNSTYSEWAQKATQWSMNVGLIDRDSHAVYDGTDTTSNCSSVNHIQWTMDTGLLLSASAYSLNSTNSSSFWSTLPSSLVQATSQYFTHNGNNILWEVACASHNTCGTDQLAFKATLARALANTRDLVADLDGPTQQSITTILQTSAQGAAAQCSGGRNGTTCGSDWRTSTWDRTSGLGQDLSALEIILANLPRTQIDSANAPNVASAGLNATSTAAENTTGTESGAASTSSNSAPYAAAYSMLGSLSIAGVIGSLALM